MVTAEHGYGRTWLRQNVVMAERGYDRSSGHIEILCSWFLLQILQSQRGPGGRVHLQPAHDPPHQSFRQRHRSLQLQCDQCRRPGHRRENGAHFLVGFTPESHYARPGGREESHRHATGHHHVRRGCGGGDGVRLDWAQSLLDRLLLGHHQRRDIGRTDPYGVVCSKYLKTKRHHVGSACRSAVPVLDGVGRAAADRTGQFGRAGSEEYHYHENFLAQWSGDWPTHSTSLLRG